MANGRSGRGDTPRTRSSGTRGARRVPGPATRGDGRPAAGPSRSAGRSRTPAATTASSRPRFTGRAAVLVLVLVLLAVSYASSLRAFLDQRRHLADLSASIEQSQADVTRLEREKKRWDDPAYVRQVAHQRFGWVLPGEIGFQVLDADGEPLDHTDSLSAPDSVTEASRPLWWQAAWGTVVTAGEAPADPSDVPPPASRIRPPAQPPGQQAGR